MNCWDPVTETPGCDESGCPECAEPLRRARAVRLPPVPWRLLLVYWVLVPIALCVGFLAALVVFGPK